MIDTFLKSTRRQFNYYKSLGDKTFSQLSDEALFWQFNKDTNSIGIIVNHMWGNMLSRWTDFLSSDGEKEWRQRDLEFENVIKDRRELLEKWEEGWACLFNALDSINTENFGSVVYIRNQEHHIIEAIHRQMNHYAYHVAQIVMIGKMCTGSNWKSLSIPKGKSREFNEGKFGKGKHDGHFTDDLK